MAEAGDWISGGSIAEDVDLLLHDAQYFAEEYDGRLGWGHSSVKTAVAYADAGGHEAVKHALLEDLALTAVDRLD